LVGFARRLLGLPPDGRGVVVVGGGGGGGGWGGGGGQERAQGSGKQLTQGQVEIVKLLIPLLDARLGAAGAAKEPCH